MAEGLQRRIEYSDLKFISSFAMEKILDFQTWEDPGEHARGNFRLLLSENGTDINSMNAPIQLLGQGNTAGALFSGYPEKVEIKEERGYRIADIQAVSGTILLDQKKSNRVFQKKVQTYMGIASAVTADTDHSACILPGSDMRTGGTLIQYQETDWRFLKRMASQLGLPLVPDTSYYYPRFYLGLPEGEKRELGEIISCDLCFDGRYYAVSGKCLVDREDFICYDVVTRTSLSLGDRVTYEGRELLVSRKKTELAGGEVIFTYRLAGNSYAWVPWEDNPDYTGMSFVGSIVGTQGEQVEVAFDIDKTAAGGNRYGFAPATGNLMYCMPQKGTKTSLYIGNGDEAQGIATGCIRTNGSTCEGTGSPEKKSFRSEHGKGMDLYPQRMGLDGGETGKITFEDETGTTIESNGGLVLMAKEGIRLESMTGIAMQGMSDIMALYSEGASSLCVNGSVDMLGRRTSLAGIVYQGYDPFEDAPQKGEFDWGGFARNLAIGLGVAIACVGLALIPGIGPIVTGALIGAAIGTFCQTVYKANEEWQSGNVRSTIETVRDVVISAAAGGFTGACVVAFPVTVLFSGEIYAGVSLTGRAAWALGDSSMNNEKKMAYIFDTKQMAVDFSIGALIGIIVPGAVARKLVRDAEREMWKNADFEAARNLSQKNSTKPNQIHHYATNKSKTYTHQMEEIAKKYGLDLNGKWNKDLLPHQGRHPNEYHEYVLNSMKQFDEVAQGNVDIFLQLYEKMKAYIKANPDMLYKAYWLQ
ncbi:AHH domain-containing protein [Roseburia intestinalis]|uniref:AHH domain-containing protein n=2 Tax=Roseburia intestinalis TaxID=166486 RepID=UPI003C771995